MRKNYADNFYLNKLYSKFFFIGNSPVISDQKPVLLTEYEVKKIIPHLWKEMI